MSVGYTYLLSVYVLGFENAGFLTQQIRLKSASCTSDQCFAIGFLQTPCYQDALAKSLLLPTYRAEQWTYTTSSAPCRAHLTKKPSDLNFRRKAFFYILALEAVFVTITFNRFFLGFLIRVETQTMIFLLRSIQITNTTEGISHLGAIAGLMP